MNREYEDTSSNKITIKLKEIKGNINRLILSTDSEIKIISSNTSGPDNEISLSYPFMLDTGAQKTQLNLYRYHYNSMLKYAVDDGFICNSANGKSYNLPILTLPCIIFGNRIKIRNLKVGIRCSISTNIPKVTLKGSSSSSASKFLEESKKEEEMEEDYSLFGLDLLRLFENNVSKYMDSWEISIETYSLMNGFLLSGYAVDTSRLFSIEEYMRTPEMYYFVKSKKPKSWKSKWDYTGILEPELKEIAIVFDFFKYIFSFWEKSPPTKEEVIEYMSSDAFYGYSTEEKKNKNDTSSDIQEF